VSSDSSEYAALSVEKGAEAPFLRPAEISGDRSTDYEFVVHALNWLALHGDEPKYIVHIRPTTPFRDPRLIDCAIDAFRNAPDATALRSVHEMSESAYKTFEISAEGRLKRLGATDTALDAANNARQLFPSTYQANGYVDVLSTTFIRQNRLIHGDRVLPYVTPAVTEVDTLKDFDLLEFELARSPNLSNLLFT
jgi:CMP-N,N'-diacetyllegionaminic acid synthase